MELIDNVEYRGYTIKVYPDEMPLNPREEFDNFGHMYCWNTDYSLGDKYPYRPDELQELATKSDIVIPLYLTGNDDRLVMGEPETVRGISRFSDGRTGYIVAWANEIRKEYGVKHISKKLRARIIDVLKGEVETYDAYHTGNVYGYVVLDRMGNEIDSCWGFYGDTDYMISEAKAMIDYDIKEHGGIQIDNVA